MDDLATLTWQLLSNALPVALLLTGILFVAILIKEKLGSERNNNKAIENFPYKLNSDFCSPTERTFHHVLTKAVAADAFVFHKVSMAEVINVRSGLSVEEQQAAYRRIKSARIDFLICDPLTLEPLAAVELDDAPHCPKHKNPSDTFKDKSLAAAGLPLLRFTARSTYSLESIRAQIQRYVPLNTLLATTENFRDHNMQPAPATLAVPTENKFDFTMQPVIKHRTTQHKKHCHLTTQ